MSRDYSKSEFSKHRAALREFESVCDKVEDLQQENEFLYNDRELVAEERDAAVKQINKTVKEIRDLNSKSRYFGRHSKTSRTMYAENYCEEKQPKKLNGRFSDWAFKGLYAVVVAAVILLACGITPELGNFAELWIEFICDPWKLSLVGIVLLGSYKILFKKQ